MLGDDDSGGFGAAACSGSNCDCDNVVLGVGDPRTSGYRLLSGGADGLPAASQLVSARLGIDGAISVRHLCLWIFLLSSDLLPLSRSLPVPTRANSCRTAGLSSAVSASRVVVVKVSSLAHRTPIDSNREWSASKAIGLSNHRLALVRLEPAAEPPSARPSLA